MPQRDEMVVTRPDQVRALNDSGFLTQFVRPTSPSDVARRLGIPANIAHHRSRRLAGLGLLIEDRRERVRVYYQLAARVFKHQRTLLGPDEKAVTMLNRIRERFLERYVRSGRDVPPDHDWTMHGFSEHGEPQPASPGIPAEPRPAHLQTRVVCLSPERYRETVREVWSRLEKLSTEYDETAAPCTFAFLAFDGPLDEGANDSHGITSFVPHSEV